MKKLDNETKKSLMMGIVACGALLGTAVYAFIKSGNDLKEVIENCNTDGFDNLDFSVEQEWD